MIPFRLSNRSMRYLTLVAWFASIAAASWVAADLLARWIAPEKVSAVVAEQSDPRLVARRISSRVLMAQPTIGSESATTGSTQDHGLTLIGLATGFHDAEGFALFRRPDGVVISATEGESITTTAILTKILPDRVELGLNGLTETLPLTHQANLTRSLPSRTAPSGPSNQR